MNAGRRAKGTKTRVWRQRRFPLHEVSKQEAQCYKRCRLRKFKAQCTYPHSPDITHIWYHHLAANSMLLHHTRLFMALHPAQLVASLYFSLHSLHFHHSLHTSPTLDRLQSFKQRDPQIPTHMTQITTSMPRPSPPSYL